MTLDAALLYRSTENLVLPTYRKFFPIKIPNSHPQLRHYISTADAGKIYVAVGRVINSIEISTGRLEVVTIVPFDPKCLTAGLGWIAVGGSNHGDCAFIKLRSSFSGGLNEALADVDSPLPIDLPSRRSFPSRLPEVIVHEFGGLIVNSITLHRLPSIGDLYAPEDIAILTNNDKTVSLFSLTRQEMLETIPHPICMNYAIISPDSSLLAAVGDEHRVYFYRVKPCPKRRMPIPEVDRVFCGWDWPLIRSVELDSDSHYNDRCCFTIAFSPSSHLCAVGSQSGIITVFDVKGVLDPDPTDRDGREDIICVFRSSRPSFEGGAVRAMSFSPRPWDLLVWVEEHGRIGVADVRQAFSRRQVVALDLEDPMLECVRVETHDDFDRADNSDSEFENRTDYQFEDVSDTPGTGRRNASLMDTERQAVREHLTRELTDRERRIINFLNTAQWASTIEGIRQGNRSPLSSSPPDRSTSRREAPADTNAGRSRGNQARRRSSVLSPDTSTPNASSVNAPGSALIPHPTFTLTWTETSSQLPRSESPIETSGSNNAGPSGTTLGPVTGRTSSSSSSGRSQGGTLRARALLNGPLAPGISAPGQQQRPHRARSIPRRQDRPEVVRDRHETALAAERLRLHRQVVLEESSRESQIRSLREAEEQQLRRMREAEQIRITPWLRNDRGLYSARERERQREHGVGTAGIGWGADGHTLYIGTEKGILEYKLDVQDRMTFPGVSCR
ncbi:hypothetical protein VTO42DRAFT_8855 [Malbranchea cinnamomea]